MFSLCFPEINMKKTVFSFLLPLINSNITLQEYRVTFYFNVFNNKKNCSEESFWTSLPLFIIESNVSLSKYHRNIRIECFQNSIFVELKIVTFL